MNCARTSRSISDRSGSPRGSSPGRRCIPPSPNSRPSTSRHRRHASSTSSSRSIRPSATPSGTPSDSNRASRRRSTRSPAPSVRAATPRGSWWHSCASWDWRHASSPATWCNSRRTSSRSTVRRDPAPISPIYTHGQRSTCRALGGWAWTRRRVCSQGRAISRSPRRRPPAVLRRSPVQPVRATRPSTSPTRSPAFTRIRGSPCPTPSPSGSGSSNSVPRSTRRWQTTTSDSRWVVSRRSSRWTTRVIRNGRPTPTARTSVSWRRSSPRASPTTTHRPASCSAVRASGTRESRCHAGRSPSCGEPTASRSGVDATSWPTRGRRARRPPGRWRSRRRDRNRALEAIPPPKSCCRRSHPRWACPPRR